MKKTRSIKFYLGFIILSVLISANYSFSQSLQFCEDVNDEGEPKNSSSVFNIDSKGGYLKLLTNLPYRVGTSSVSYQIYKIDDDGVENYDNTIVQEVDPSWTWFWKEITFYKAGRYKVEVYDGDRNYLTSAQVRIQYY